MSARPWRVTATWGQRSRWWEVEVPDLRIQTRAASRETVELVARDAVATRLELPYDLVQVEVTWTDKTGCAP